MILIFYNISYLIKNKLTIIYIYLYLSLIPPFGILGGEGMEKGLMGEAWASNPFLGETS